MKFSETDKYIQQRMDSFQCGQYPMRYAEGYVDGIDIEGREAIDWAKARIIQLIRNLEKTGDMAVVCKLINEL